MLPDHNGQYGSQRIYITLAPRDVAKFKFLLEGYDNLGVLSILDKYKSVAQLRFAPGQHKAVRTFLQAIASEVPFAITDLTHFDKETS